MTSQLKQKIQSIIRNYITSGKADKLRTEGMDEIRCVVRNFGVEKFTASELQPLLSEVTNQLKDKFLQERVGELSGQTQRSLNSIVNSGTTEAKKIDRSIIDGVIKGINEGVSGNMEWRDVSRIALRKLNLAEHHVETNINTIQNALDNASRFEQFKSGGATHLRYSGPSGTKRPFCVDLVGKI